VVKLAKEVLRSKEVSERYDVTVLKLQKMVKAGEIRAGRVGRCLRFDIAECDRVFKGIKK
jgi:excisionase family DNA binding protein